MSLVLDNSVMYIWLHRIASDFVNAIRIYPPWSTGVGLRNDVKLEQSSKYG